MVAGYRVPAGCDNNFEGAEKEGRVDKTRPSGRTAHITLADPVVWRTGDMRSIADDVRFCQDTIAAVSRRSAG